MSGFFPHRALPGGLLAAAVLASSCGGAASPSAPVTPIPTPTPQPTPTPTPTPDPNVPPKGSGCHKPYPPPIDRFNVKIHYKQPDYWVIDSTPLVANANYCRRIGYSDRSICPLRMPGSDDREACEQWRAGTAADTGKPGPTWTVTLRNRTTSYCTGPTGPCEHIPGLPFDVKAYLGGVYRVCTEDGSACGQVDVDRGIVGAMGTPHPTETHRLFEHDRVAAGYASARPYLHPQVFAVVRDAIRPSAPFRRALDVGCGTGLSSSALLGLAQEVVGIDASVEMLRHASRASGVRYAASRAETPPFRARTFGLVVACGSIDWVDRSCFVPRAAELLERGGWLVPLDFGDTGRSPEVPGLARWYDDVFQSRYPRPASRDPLVTAEEAACHGFEAPVQRAFVSAASFTARQYAAFLMTESNVIAAIEFGSEAADRVRAWLESELLSLFGEGSRPVAFSGYVQALRRC